MIKSYVIDTNILIQAPYACQCFEENRVIYHWSYWKNWMDSRKQKEKKGQMPDGRYVS